MDMIKVIASGRLGQDPRVRQLDDGTPVLNLSMANGRKKKGEEITFWWDVTMFGQRGLTLHDMLRKGSHVLVEGDYNERTYTDKQGQQRTQREIIATNIYLLDRKADGDQARPAYQGGQQQSPPAFGGERSRPFPQPQQQSLGRHRDGLNQQRSFGGAAAPQDHQEPPPFDDDIPF